MRRLASSQFASLNTVLTHTGHVLQGAEATQYNTHIHKGTHADMNTHARTHNNTLTCTYAKYYKSICMHKHTAARSTQIIVTYSGAKTSDLHVRSNAYTV